MTYSERDDQHWRLIPFGYDTAADQLAVSEAVLESVSRHEQPPTLRLYSWSNPTLILGIAQPISDVDEDECSRRGCEVVRRSSGGTAVYYDACAVSFDLTVPSGSWLSGGDVHRNYARLADVLLEVLRGVGVTARAVTLDESRASITDPGLSAVCFASLSPYEIVMGSQKLVGLAQIRRVAGTTLHGALYLKFCPGDIVRLLQQDDVDAAGVESKIATLARSVTDLDSSVARPIGPPELTQAFVDAVASVLDASVAEQPLSEVEQARAQELARDKYRSPEWTRRR